ncbi:hypothetical protein ACFQU7_12715 [Pseudoroseomonas wenyumeiae]
MQATLPAEATRIAPGLFRLRMALPFPPSHVNCWLLRDGEGWLVVDAGARIEGRSSSGKTPSRACWKAAPSRGC